MEKKKKKKKNLKKKEKSTPWLTTTKRYVGFLDIMGFKDMLLRNGHNNVYKLMQKVSQTVASVESTMTVDYESEFEFDINVRMIFYSDSIIFYSRDDEQHSLENFIGCISTLSDFLFEDGIPHKGAIAYGQMTLDYAKSIFFGQPFVDAYLLQEELKYYGIVVHGTAEKKGDINQDESIIEFNCPFKNGFAKHLTIAPGVSLNEEFEEKTVDRLRNRVLKLRENTSGAIRKYVDNTIDYLNFVKAEGQRILKEEEEKYND